MNVLKVKKGETLARKQDKVMEWYLIQEGSVIRQFAFAEIIMHRNAIVGILENEWFACDYVANEDTTLIVIPCKNAQDLRKILSEHENFRPIFLRTAVEQRHQALCLYASLQKKCMLLHNAAETLYSEYKNLMYYTANRILRNSRDAEDVVHQAFLKVIEILDTISSPRCHKTRALLVTITEHKAIDLYREKQRRNVLPLAEEYVGAAPAAEIERLAERDTLAAAIAALPPRYRSVLLLRYDCGYSNAEIANILDTTEPNVRKLIQRAKEKLSAALSGMEEP